MEMFVDINIAPEAPAIARKPEHHESP